MSEVRDPSGIFRNIFRRAHRARSAGDHPENPNRPLAPEVRPVRTPAGSRPHTRPITPEIIVDENLESELDSSESELSEAGEERFEELKRDMQNNPLGAEILNLAKDGAKFADKTKVKESHVNVGKLVKGFSKFMKNQEFANAENVKEAVSLVEQHLLESDLNTHRVNPVFTAPTYFSPGPTLFTTSQRNEAMKLFPCRTKFSGSKAAGQMSVVEYLSTIAMAQNQAKLSKDEFLEMLKLTTTARAHLLLLEWTSTESSVDSIYHLFALHFDSRISPEVARKQLYAFKIPKSSNLAIATTEIMELASRIASQMPTGDARSVVYNMEAVQGLLRSLPPISSGSATNVYANLSSRLSRAASISELSRALNVSRQAIDSDIKQNGSSGYNKYENTSAAPVYNKRQIQKFKPKQAFAGNVNIEHTAQHQGKVLAIEQQRQPSGKTPTGSGARGGRSNGNISRGASRGRGRGGGSNNNLGNRYCSLCGAQNHTAAQGCRNMKDDDKNIVSVLPTHNTCNICPPHVNPRLAHPQSLCPYRPNGCWHK